MIYSLIQSPSLLLIGCAKLLTSLCVSSLIFKIGEYNSIYHRIVRIKFIPCKLLKQHLGPNICFIIVIIGLLVAQTVKRLPAM